MSSPIQILKDDVIFCYLLDFLSEAVNLTVPVLLIHAQRGIYFNDTLTTEIGINRSQLESEFQCVSLPFHLPVCITNLQQYDLFACGNFSLCSILILYMSKLYSSRRRCCLDSGCSWNLESYDTIQHFPSVGVFQG